MQLHPAPNNTTFVGIPWQTCSKTGKIGWVELLCVSVHWVMQAVLQKLSIAGWLRAHGKFVRPELTKQQRQDLKECFELIDTDGSGIHFSAFIHVPCALQYRVGTSDSIPSTFYFLSKKCWHWRCWHAIPVVWAGFHRCDWRMWIDDGVQCVGNACEEVRGGSYVERGGCRWLRRGGRFFLSTISKGQSWFHILFHLCHIAETKLPVYPTFCPLTNVLLSSMCGWHLEFEVTVIAHGR